MIAYRSLTHQYLPSGNDKGLLTFFDPRTGRTIKQVSFDRGPSGCGGAYGPVIQAMYDAHFASFGLDAFTWSPDQHTMLVAYGCFNGPSEQIDPNNGATQAITYPEDASYQPGGALILGILPNQALGMVDFSNHLVRALVNQPAPNAQTTHGMRNEILRIEDGCCAFGICVWLIHTFGEGEASYLSPSETNTNGEACSTRIKIALS